MLLLPTLPNSSPHYRRRTLLLAAMLLLLTFTVAGQCNYIMRYSTIANGAMTMTGNTLGLDKSTATGTTGNQPGIAGSIGCFITTDTAQRDTSPSPGWPSYVATYNAGTTSDWTINQSTGQLRMVAGSTVLYAELIWGGCYETTNQNVSASYNGYVNLTPPGGATSQITPDAATTGSNFTLTGSGRYYYVRSADVTSYVKTYGAGMYKVGHVPGTVDYADVNANATGWTLCVIYSNPSLPARNMTLFIGAELTDQTTQPVASVSGFCTPQTGTVKGRMLITTIEGDASITGDNLMFGATNPPTNTVTTPLNPSNNFFNSGINYYDESTSTLSQDTSGTFGTLNNTLAGSTFTMVNAARQGWDITNADVSSYLTNGQSVAYAQGVTNTDRYTITGLGLEINVGAPVFTPSTLAINKTLTYVGDTLTYTATMNNTTGTADANNCIFTNHGPTGLGFVAGSVTVNGVANTTANVENGVNVGTIAKGASTTVVYKYKVNYVPAVPGTGQFTDSSTWLYSYTSCPGYPANNGTFTTNAVVATVPKLTITKVNNPTTLLHVNDTVQYTVSIANTGTVATAGSTFVDPIPAGLVYVANSATLNGVAVADVGGAMAFATERAINGPGDASGVIGVGHTATVVFTCKCTNQLTRVTNTATVDPDGSANPAPNQSAVVYNPVQSADLSLTITDGKTTTAAGDTNNYTITITNNGPDTVSSCNVIFTHPTGAMDLSYTPSVGTYDSTTGNWTGITLANGQSITLIVHALVFDTTSGTVTMNANVTGPAGYGDVNTANNAGSDTDTIIYNVDLAVVKTDNRDVVLAGNADTYTITITNYGPSTASSVYVVDTLPGVFLNPVFTPSVGVYNLVNGMWTGVNLQTGQSATMTLTGTVQTGATGTMANTVHITAQSGYTDTNANNDYFTDTDTIGYVISGYVYSDADHNYQKTGAEGGLGIAGLYAKLQPGAGGNATVAVAVDATTGAYSFTSVNPGTYNILLDNNNTLTDVTTYRPVDWLGTENAAQKAANVVLTTTNVLNVNIGLWHGSTLNGIVFNDTGVGAGGVPNDGLKNGTEAGLATVEVRATNTAGTTTYETENTDTSGAYTLWIPYMTPGAINIREFNLPAYVSTGGAVGTTAGTYTRTTDILLFTYANGTAYTGVNFADVPTNIFTNDGQKSTPPGTVVYYPHVFTAGTGGSINFTTTATPNPNMPGWSVILYRDTNADGVVQPTETAFAGPVTVNAGDQIALVLKVFIPDNAPESATESVAVNSVFTYTNAAAPALVGTITHTDLTTVNTTMSMTLSLTVDKANAKSGDVLNYTLTYKNIGLDPLQNVVLNNATPPFTTFVSAAFGALPANLTGCAITTPAVGATGGIHWTFTGALAPGSTGTVSFQVQIQ